MTSARVSSEVGGVAALGGTFDSAMLKQVEWAAAINSSRARMVVRAPRRVSPGDLEVAEAGRHELDLALALEEIPPSALPRSELRP